MHGKNFADAKLRSDKRQQSILYSVGVALPARSKMIKNMPVGNLSCNFSMI
jgi:hypothetical protein